MIIGKQAIDDDSNQVGQMLAEMLGWPQATFASKVEIAGTKCTVVREVDGGLETIGFDLPAVITTDLRLNEPRYASLPGIMKARKKELKEIPVDSLGVDLAPKLKIKALAAPPKRQAGRKVGSVEELVGSAAQRSQGDLTRDKRHASRLHYSSHYLRVRRLAGASE